MRFLLSRGLLFRLLERDYRLQLEIKYLICLSISRHVILLIGVIIWTHHKRSIQRLMPRLLLLIALIQIYSFHLLAPDRLHGARTICSTTIAVIGARDIVINDILYYVDSCQVFKRVSIILLLMRV